MERVNLSTCTPEQIQEFVNKELAKSKHDPEYCLKMKVEELDHKIRIRYTWFPGKPKQPSDPTVALDDVDPIESWFCVHKNESLRKLTKEIMDAIEEVVSVPFNPVMEREGA
jgi:hypothetical protein